MFDILIVDDIAENLQVLQLILKCPRFRIRAATSGHTALQLIDNQTPDLIITDIKMPKMSGVDLCRILKSNKATSHIPIVFVSAYTDTENIVEALEVGGVDYISKPFRPAEINARVNTQIKLLEVNALQVKRQLSDALNKMVIGVAHEINTPLGTGITAVSHLLALTRELIDAFEQQTLSQNMLCDSLIQSCESIKLCERSLGRVAEFVNLLKTISKAESPAQPGRCDFVEVMDQLVSQYCIDDTGVEFKLTSQSKNMPMSLDANLVQLVMSNIIEDSICHGLVDKKGPIEIKFAVDHELLEIQYCDNGVGLIDVTVDELLKPFVTSRRGNLGHVGLSAPVAANIISGALEGEYSVASTERGLQWVIRLPIVNLS
ncbi:hybrid sensor histidine kinase/response regulator [Pseudoalteromonas sp. MMG013]|uniref:hybrid sensor histidine kinase/response regulator n=1 Tax=unclassified Pseudoalteromonas TaxID=194690 RepID=UPI001B3791DD|nr:MULTISPECIES: response regulator [unclassified Pseudoalteromonas]MBQ4849450.1 hybrid sensor histidine kinase/response regulator [Pseudoalteromonas sp. MMG012]MBQ4862819.1 hybrid sensor histidine kinase/response regulator [Pseudoalteromonas sp. MMG013]